MLTVHFPCVLFLTGGRTAELMLQAFPSHRPRRHRFFLGVATPVMEAGDPLDAQALGQRSWDTSSFCVM